MQVDQRWSVATFKSGASFGEQGPSFATEQEATVWADANERLGYEVVIEGPETYGNRFCAVPMDLRTERNGSCILPWGHFGPHF